jgi:phosphoglycerate dehydrogenase-like enzyme
MAVAIITFILTLSLKLPAKIALGRAGLWDERPKYLGVSLVGKTLGSVGVGGIGHELFRLIKPFGMQHIACDPYIKKEELADVDVNLVDMDTLLAESDFLAVNCPLNKETYHIIGENELRKMKKEAFLINTSRGPTVDEAVLIKALREKWIMGAGIDVFEQEPTPVDNPLLNMDNVIATPHALGWEDSVWGNKWDENISQIAKVINGEIPDGLVNRQVWDNPEFRDKFKIFQDSIR